MEKVNAFLKKHGMLPENICPSKCAYNMAEDMRRGLNGEKSSVPMIPTFLKAGTQIPKGKSAAVIDAGGTNFRRALLTFTDRGYDVEYLKKEKMLGIKKPVTWDEFISFTADNIMPLMDKTDCIGFCFSYSAEILPDIDGRVSCIDKEVVIKNSAGQLLGKSLNDELGRRGVERKRIVILNDTTAVLLGGSSMLDTSKYSDFIAQVSGTGTNTCCAVPAGMIGELSTAGKNKIIVNTESGMYDGLPFGDFDWELDKENNNPNRKLFEKMTAGLYLGNLCTVILKGAVKEGLLSRETGRKLDAIGKIDSSYLDAWSCGEKLEVVYCEEDREFVVEVSKALFRRSAACMCTNLAALLLLTGGGRDKEKPVCICAEGSLVQKGRVYRPVLKALIEEHINGIMGLNAVLVPVEDSTLPGAAAAVLLNP